MAKGPRDRESVGDELDVIDLVTDEQMSTARGPEPEAGDEDRPPRRRRLLVLVIAAGVVAIAGVTVVVSRDDGDAEGVGIASEELDAEGGPGNRGASNAPPRTAPDGVPGSTTIPPDERLPTTTPGDASTSAPLLAEGAPSTPHIGELVASVWRIGVGSYYVYADGRLIWRSDQAGAEAGFVEQRLTLEGVQRVRSTFLDSGLFNPAQLPGDVPYCRGPACVRGDDGRLLSAPESGPVSSTEAALLHTYLMTLDSSLPETEWAAPRIRTYVAPRIQVCLGTFLNVPDRAVPVPSDLSILLPAFPTRAAELLSDRELIGPPGPAPCFEVTLEEARTLADEFLSPAGGGSHEYSGIVIRDPQFDAIPPVGIVAYINFQALLPDGGPAL